MEALIFGKLLQFYLNPFFQVINSNIELAKKYFKNVENTTQFSNLYNLEGGGGGTPSSEESPESSEDDLYQGGTGVNSGERQCEQQNRIGQLGQTVRSPITTLLGHIGVVISCGTSIEIH